MFTEYSFTNHWGMSSINILWQLNLKYLYCHLIVMASNTSILSACSCFLCSNSISSMRWWLLFLSNANMVFFCLQIYKIKWTSSYEDCQHKSSFCFFTIVIIKFRLITYCFKEILHGWKFSVLVLQFWELGRHWLQNFGLIVWLRITYGCCYNFLYGNCFECNNLKAFIFELFWSVTFPTCVVNWYIVFYILS